MNLNIGFFADGQWSHKTFEKLKKDNDIQISFICVRWDTNDQVLKEYSEKYNIPYLKHTNINSKDFIDVVKAFECDLFVSMSFNQIFKEKLFNLPRFKTINCHAGKLPFYRGRNILNWALINDEKEFGITVHFIDAGIDTGDIISQRCFPITDQDDYSSLLRVAFKECSNLLYEVILMFKKDTVRSIPQSTIHNVGFYCSERKIGDENINWNQSSRNIFNFVRAISKPGPVARAFIGQNEFKINKVEMIFKAPNKIGKPGVILVKENDGFVVKTQDNFIKVVNYESNKTIKVGDQFEIK